MSPPDQGEITDLLAEWSDGDGEALERLMPLVFDELRQLAQTYFRREAESHTLQPTALVNEVYVRLTEQRQVQWENRSQFFAFASLLMRRILVDHAKAKRAAKRGGGVAKLPLDEALVGAEVMDVDVLALDQALNRLAEVDDRQARIVQMRFFAGLTQEEIADVLDISLSTVKREWRTARLFLLREITEMSVESPNSE